MSISVRANQRIKKTQPLVRGAVFQAALGMMALATATALIVSYCNIQATHLSYQVTQAQDMQKELKEVARRLKVELNHLRTPARLEREGARLGLARPGEDRTRRLP